MSRSILVAVRILTDLVVFAAVFVAMGVLQNITPHQLGYFTGDVSLMHPYKSSTIPSWLLYAVTIALIVFTIIAVELAISWDYLNEKISGFPVILITLYNHLVVAFFGYCVTIAIVDIGKAAVGRPRPNFMESCKPTSVSTTKLDYVTQFTCGTKDTESIKSFPSGHAATAIFTAIYLCIYVQLRQPIWRIPALRVAYQAILLCLGLLTCTSRVVDNKHHPTDVIAGGFLGLAIAFSVPFYMCQLFPRTLQNEVRRVTSWADGLGASKASDPDSDGAEHFLSIGQTNSMKSMP